MPSTFFGLDIAGSGMATYNAWLSTTAHNLANVQTEGYTRQDVIQSAKIPISLKTSYGMVGAGVKVDEILSSRDEYYDYKYRKTNATYGYYSAAEYYMKSIEDSLYTVDEESGGLSTSVDKFFTTLSNLTTDPTDVTIRAEVTGYADSMAKYAAETYRNLTQLQSDVNNEIGTVVNQINSYAEQLASLSKQINTLEVYGNRANDLRDQRATIIDKLSELVDVEVVEKEPAEGKGISQFIVSLGGGVLVDGQQYNTIEVTASQTRDHQGDVLGLYDVQWSNGQGFATRSTQLGGKLQALFELRDGNNQENFVAGLTGYESSNANYSGASTLTLKSNELSGENASNLAKLNIPESDGVVDIGNFTYEYKSFEVSVSADGTYTYTFVLEDQLTSADVANLDRALASSEPTATIGDAVAFRGVPYYMSQLNEFLRTFSANVNQIQNTGYDLNGNLGQDLLVATDKVSGQELTMKEFLYNNEDGYYYYGGYKILTEAGRDAYIGDYTQQAVDGQPGFYDLINADGDVVERVFIPDSDESIFTFSSTTYGKTETSYYSITAATFAASDAMVKNGSLLACAARNPISESGKSEGDNLLKLVNLQNDNKMFKQGNPTGFLQVMTATVGVDSAKIIDATESSKNIVDAVANRRLSTTGVDEDEEGQKLIVAQNLLNIQYRVISVMNEVLDKLINETGV